MVKRPTRIGREASKPCQGCSPFSSAIEAVSSLKVEPGSYTPTVTRLKRWSAVAAPTSLAS